MNPGDELEVVDFVTWTFALIAVVLRAYTRLWIRRDSFGLDDVLMFISMAGFTTYIAFGNTGFRYGTDDYSDEVSIRQGKMETMKVCVAHPPCVSFTQVLKVGQFLCFANLRCSQYWWACYHAYTFTVLFTKLSVSWFLLRLTTINKTHRYIIYGNVLVTTIACSVFALFTIFQCTPVSYFWTREVEEDGGKCLAFSMNLYVSYVCSVLMCINDLVCALLPAWIIYHLHMRLKTRLALTTLLCMGCVYVFYLTRRVSEQRNPAANL